MQEALHFTSGDYKWLPTIFDIESPEPLHSMPLIVNFLTGLHRFRAVYPILKGIPPPYLGSARGLLLGCNVQCSGWCPELDGHDDDAY